MEDKTILSREAILSADDHRREYVDMPEWGGGVYIQMITAKAGLEMVGRSEDNGQNQAVVNVGRLLVMAVVDGDGRPLFSHEDIPPLMEKSRTAIDRLSEAIMKLNKMGSRSEDAEKN